MKITKFVHSCLLIEDEGKVTLIDPGMFSVKLLKPKLSEILKLDYLLITHEHFDHMDLPLVTEIVERLEPTKIMSTKSVKNILAKEQIDVSDSGDEYVQIEAVPHQSISPLGETPENVLFRINNKLTHPGDSLSFSSTKEILALPVQAPWGSVVEAIQLAINLKPQIIIPIHDWHWRDEARISQYDRLQEYFLTIGINFIKPQDNNAFDL